MTKEHAEFLAERIEGAHVSDLNGDPQGFKVVIYRTMAVVSCIRENGDVTMTPERELTLLNMRIQVKIGRAIADANAAGFPEIEGRLIRR